MKRIVITLLLLINLIGLPLAASAESIEVSGNVSGNWTADTVNVAGNLEVRSAELLQIDPGVTVLFHGSYYFKVSGCLRALGTQDELIVFTMADTTGFHNDTLPDGGWSQIRIENINPTVDSTIFRHCHFEYGKAVAADSVHGYGGAICVRNAKKVAVTNCSFNHNYAYFNGGAIYLENAPILIDHNQFQHNRCGQAEVYYGYGGALCNDNSEAHIRNNYFGENSSTGVGGGLCVRFSDCPVLFNVFDNNYSALGGGLGMLHIDTCRFTVSNNLVVNNGAFFFGAGISNGDCSPTYVNNTIVNNNCDGGGGGFYCKDSVVPVLVNNILYGNTQYAGQRNQVYLWDILSQPAFYYNNVQGGPDEFDGTGASDFTGAYQHNISEDPLFEPGSYELDIQSPCINAGNTDTTGWMIPAVDLAGHLRIVDDTIDLGAYERQHPDRIDLVIGTDENILLDVFPNPTTEYIHIHFNLQIAEHITLKICDMNGRTVRVICSESLVSGHHTFTQPVDQLPNGSYVLVLKTGKRLKISRFVKI